MKLKGRYIKNRFVCPFAHSPVLPCNRAWAHYYYRSCVCNTHQIAVKLGKDVLLDKKIWSHFFHGRLSLLNEHLPYILTYRVSCCSPVCNSSRNTVKLTGDVPTDKSSPKFVIVSISLTYSAFHHSHVRRSSWVMLNICRYIPWETTSVEFIHGRHKSLRCTKRDNSWFLPTKPVTTFMCTILLG